MKKLKNTIDALQNELSFLKHSHPLRLIKALEAINKLKSEDFTGSGIVISIKNINDSPFEIQEFLIRDGFSLETLESLKKDVVKSLSLDISIRQANSILKAQL